MDLPEKLNKSPLVEALFDKGLFDAKVTDPEECIICRTCEQICPELCVSVEEDKK